MRMEHAPRSCGNAEIGFPKTLSVIAMDTADKTLTVERAYDDLLRRSLSHISGDFVPLIYLAAMRQPANAARRERMREQQQMSILQLAPGTSVPIAKFHKIDWAIELGTPAHWLDFPNAGIDLHKRAGTQQRIESHIMKDVVAVS